MSTPLAGYILSWVNANHTNGSWLFTQAALPPSLFTQLKRGSTPRPDTLRRLAAVMDVPKRRLFELAGYIDQDEFDEDEIDIADPEIALFFRGYEWDEFTNEEQDIIRNAVRMARSIREARKRVELSAVAEQRAEYTVDNDDR